MRTSTLFTILPFFLAGSLVSAHGVVEQITIAGKTYAGPPRGVTGAPAGQTLGRQVNDNGPVAGPSAGTMACGSPGKPAAIDAAAMPGDSVSFKWSSSWPHVVGPVMTYMADCGGDCSSFDVSQAKWFKIDQKGFKASGQWFQADIAAGQPDTVTIPQNLKPGHYLIRNEIIATHNTPAEFYPSCAQVSVGGSGTGAPSADELVSFPGGYSGSEPGLANGYSQKADGYQFPGPQISKLASGGASTPPVPAAQPVNNSGSSPSAPAPVDAPAPSSAPAPVDVPSSSPPAEPSQTVPRPAPSGHAPAPSPSSVAPPIAPPATTQAPPSQPSQVGGSGYESNEGYEHGYGRSESCRESKHSRTRLIRSARPTSTGVPAEAAQDMPIAATPEASAPPSNVRRAAHSRVMRRMAASHAH